MGKKRKVFAVAICALIVLLAAIGFSACKKISLNKFVVPENIEAEIGTELTLPAGEAEDSEGTRLFPDISVTDSEGTAVDITGNKFYVTDLNGYTAIYTVTYGDNQTESKTLRINVKDTGIPVIDLGGKSNLFVLKGREFFLPEARVSDASGEKIVASVIVKKGDTEIIPQDGVVVLTESGDYEAVYTAKDSSGNVGTRTLPITCAYEENTVMYFGYQGGDSMAGADQSVAISSSTDITYKDEVASLHVHSVSESGFTDLLFTDPAIVDLTDYSAMYVYIYNDSAFEIDVTTNQVFNPSKISSGTWGILQIYKTETGWVKDSYSDVDDKRAFAIGDMTEKNPATETNINDFKISFQGESNGELNVYLSNVKVTKNGRAPGAEYFAHPLMKLNEEAAITLPRLTSYCGGEVLLDSVQIITPSGKIVVPEKKGAEYRFTPVEEGKHSVIYEFTDDGNGLSNYFDVRFIAADLTDFAGQIVPLEADYALDLLSANGDTELSILDEPLIGNEKKVLKVSSYGYEFTDIKIVSPAITDISNVYSVSYFIYNPTNQVLETTVNNNGKAVVIRTLKPNRWTFVEYTSTDFSEVFPVSGDAMKYPTSSEDISNFTIHILNKNEEKSTQVFITTPRVRMQNENIPSIIENPNIAFTNREIAIPKPAVANNVQVKVNIYDATFEVASITDYRFTPVNAGVYDIEYILTAENGDVTIVTKTLNVISEELYADGDMYLLDTESVLSMHNITGGAFSDRKHGGEKGSLEIKGNTEFLDLIMYNCLTPNITSYDSFYVWIYNANEKDGTGYFNNQVPRFTLKANAWTQIEVIKDGTEWKMNGMPIALFGTDSSLDKFQITFDNPALETLTYYVGKIVARTGRNPVAENNLGSMFELNDKIDLTRIALTDYEGNSLTAEFEIIAPNGEMFRPEDMVFTAEQIGEYKIYVSYENGNFVFDEVFAITVFDETGIDKKIFAPVENMPLEGNFLDYAEERIRFLSGEGYSYGDDEYVMVVNALADGGWIDFKICFDGTNLGKVDRLTFYFKSFAANAKGTQLYLKSNGTDHLLAMSGIAETRNPYVANVVAGKWTEITIFKDQFESFFGEDIANLTQLHFLINPDNGEGYQSMWYEYAFTSISAKTEKTILQMSESLDVEASFSGTDGEKFAFESNPLYVYGNDKQSLRVNGVDGAWIDFWMNVEKINMAETEKIYFYVMRTAANANGAITLQGKNGSQMTVVSSENALLNQWIKVEISASMFAEVFGDSLEIDTLRIIINNTAADGVAYDYQFFVSSIYVEYN